MSRAVDAIATRLAALMAGTYTAGGRYVTGATFTVATPVSSAASPEWQDVPTDRVYEVEWSAQGDETTPPSTQGPSPLTIRATLRVQYALDRPSAFEPSPASLGLSQTPSQRALGDHEALRWIFRHLPVWSGVAFDCVVGDASIARTDPLRLVLSFPLTWKVSVSATAAPGWS